MMSHPPVRPGNTPGHSTNQPPSRFDPKKEHNFLPTTRSRNISYVLAILAMLMSTFVVLGNVLGSKVIQIGPVILDGGIVVFPIIWTVQDIMVQVFYRRTANVFCGIVACVNLISVFALFLCSLLPGAEGVVNPNFQTLFGFSARVFLASSIGYFFRSYPAPFWCATL